MLRNRAELGQSWYSNSAGHRVLTPTTEQDPTVGRPQRPWYAVMPAGVGIEQMIEATGNDPLREESLR